MTKQRMVNVLLLAVAAASAVGFCWVFFAEHKVVKTQDELQKMFNDKLPKTFDGATIEGVQLKIGKEKIGLEITASTTIMKREWHAQATASGAPFYDSKRGAIYFIPDQLGVKWSRSQPLDTSDPAVAATEESLSQKTARLVDWAATPRLSAHKDKLVQAASKMSQHADDSKKFAIAKFDSLKQAAINKLDSAGQALVGKAARLYLDNLPVWVLPSHTKGLIAWLAVEKAEIHDSSVVITVSAWHLTGAAIGCVVAFLVAILLLMAIFQNPELLSDAAGDAVGEAIEGMLSGD